VNERRAILDEMYDVVIIGAGLAGLSTAATIAFTTDAAIAIVEERGIGSNNPTPLTFADVTERFDLDKHVIGRYRQYTFHSPLGNRSSHSYDTHPLVTLDYRGACDELFWRSQMAGNVGLISSRAIDLKRTADGNWQVRLAAGQVVTTPLLIDASGRQAFATRNLGLPAPRMFSHVFGQSFSGGTVPDSEEAFFLAPCDRFGDGGGWLYPFAEKRISFGYATLSNHSEYPGALTKQRYDRALAEFAPYTKWLASAQPGHTESGTIPICPPRRLVYDGLMLVGDAAALATIWSCMGVEPALISGQLAGHAAIEACRRRDYSAAKLGSYQKQWEQANRRIYRQGLLLASASWRQGEVSWNNQIPLVQQLTPEQMLARLRVNWPLLPWWKIAFIMIHDWAGRTRRSLTVWLSGLRRPKGARP